LDVLVMLMFLVLTLIVCKNHAWFKTALQKDGNWKSFR